MQNQYRNPSLVKQWAEKIHAITTRPWCVMEACGGQTHAIVKYGLQSLLPDSLQIIHGPGCPVCVTPIEIVDKAIELCRKPAVILCTYGDMLRVPGTGSSLRHEKAKGADVRIITNTMEVLKLAQMNPDHEIVLLAIGFETTAPIHAAVVSLAETQKIHNLSLLVSQTRVPPALKYLLDSPDNCVQGFLAAGHVCTIMGTEEYHDLVRAYHVPITITGFEPVDILKGLYSVVQQLEQGEFYLDNQYSRWVSLAGNRDAKQYMSMFEVVDQNWRGIGVIPRSGLALSNAYQSFDAISRFSIQSKRTSDSTSYCGEILLGKRLPKQCPEFNKCCTPESPIGAPMVSSEGACAAYFTRGLIN